MVDARHLLRDGTDVEISRASPTDYAAGAALLSSFAPEALSPEQRQYGYLQHSFEPDAIRVFDQSAAVVVAKANRRLVAILCADRLTNFALTPPVAALKAALPAWTINGRPILPASTLCYGPVAISIDYQGRGLLRPLFDTWLEIASPGFEHVVCFVAPDNERSLQAQRHGLGMEILGSFSNGQLIALGRPVHLDKPHHSGPSRATP